MAKNQEGNLKIYHNGTAEDVDKTPAVEPGHRNILADLGIDKKMMQDVIQPLIKDVAVKAIKDAAGLDSTKSGLRKGSYSHGIATFFKEIATPLMVLSIFFFVLIVVQKLVWRYFGF